MNFTYAKSDEDWQKQVCGDYRKCAWPGCGSTWQSAGHHIFDRRHKPLRLVIENGICLCGKHHSSIEAMTPDLRERASILLVGKMRYKDLVCLLQTSAESMEIPKSSISGESIKTFW